MEFPVPVTLRYWSHLHHVQNWSHPGSELASLFEREKEHLAVHNSGALSRAKGFRGLLFFFPLKEAPLIGFL